MSSGPLRNHFSRARMSKYLVHEYGSHTLDETILSSLKLVHYVILFQRNTRNNGMNQVLEHLFVVVFLFLLLF